jgi:hypothetical protein
MSDVALHNLALSFQHGFAAMTTRALLCTVSSSVYHLVAMSVAALVICYCGPRCVPCLCRCGTQLGPQLLC